MSRIRKMCCIIVAPFIAQVPLVVADTLGIGSMAPGALLLEASKGFQVLHTISVLQVKGHLSYVRKSLLVNALSG